MTDTPPTPPHPKAAVKGLAGHLKGKPAWMYVAGITVIIGLAFFIRRRESAATGDTPNVVDNTTGAVGDNSLFPSASQGAFGGYSDPTVNSTGTDTSNDNAGQPETPTFVINFPGPVQAEPTPVAPATIATAAAVTGGGTKAPRVVEQHAQIAVTPLQKAAAIIHTIQAGAPAHAATAAQQTAQAKAAAAPNIFTQDNGSRSGLNYQLVHKNGKWYRFYESKPGKGDWGAGGKVLRP